MRTCPACKRDVLTTQAVLKAFDSRGLLLCPECGGAVCAFRLVSSFVGGLAIGVIFLVAPAIVMRNYYDWRWAVAAAVGAALVSFMVNRQEARIALLIRHNRLSTRLLQFAVAGLGFFSGFIVVAMLMVGWFSAAASGPLKAFVP